MPTSYPALPDACGAGRLNPEDWVQQLIDMVSDRRVSNSDLLLATTMAAKGCDHEHRREWMDNLLEFSLWETGTIPDRLALCDHMVREGVAVMSSPKRWASCGSLLHVACEAGSLAAIAWAAEREPSAAIRPGGRLRIGAMQSICMHDDDSTMVEGISLLARAGARASHLSSDGRSALFRCSVPKAAQLLMELGADPWLPDVDGYCAVGLWLELGLWGCASNAFASRPGALDEPIAWGSLGMRARKPQQPLVDRPLFIAACTTVLRGPASDLARSESLLGLAALGADPLLLDARGARLTDRSACPCAASLCERAELTRQGAALPGGAQPDLAAGRPARFNGAHGVPKPQPTGID